MSKKVDPTVSASNPPSLCITELYYPDGLLPRTRGLGLAGFEWQLQPMPKNTLTLPCPMVATDRMYTALRPGHHCISYSTTVALARGLYCIWVSRFRGGRGVYGSTPANTASVCLCSLCLHHDEKTCVTGPVQCEGENPERSARRKTKKSACCCTR